MATTPATLSATSRADTGKGVARKLRSAGQIPAVVYGHGRQAQPLAVNTRDFERLIARIGGDAAVVELAIDGRPARTLIREIQRHPFRRVILHVDFQELVAGEMVTMTVPLTLVGIADGVRNGGGVLDQSMREITIQVDPANIPSHIDVDVSSLTIGHPLHVRDLTLPAGVTVLDDPDSAVAQVQVSRAGVENAAAAADAAAATEAAAAEPEVIRAKKGEDEGEK